MKKKNILILSLACILSMCFFTGLLIYTFHSQTRRDQIVQNLRTASSANIKTVQKKTDPVSTSENQPENSGITPAKSDNSSPASKNNKDSSNKASVTPAASKDTNKAAEQSDGNSDKSIVLGFAGDINFSEGSQPMAKYDAEKKGILGGLSSSLVSEMKAVNIMMLNNEFPYSTRGTKTPEKSFTFRANPKRVNILKEMGVDIVSLANNHALDYGRDALADTFTTLDKAGIDYIGAGDHMDRAKAPVYIKAGNSTIAYVAASRVVYSTDWYATDNRSGMIGTYDPALFLRSIKEAAANSDYVVAFVHWGVERNNYPEDYQRALAKKYIDAGADAVIGCHPHVMQGFEFYKKKIIAYSLGNFWFNSSNRESGMLKLYLDSDKKVRVQILPAMQKNTYTYLLKAGQERKHYFSFMQELSYHTIVDKNGFVSEAAK